MKYINTNDLNEPIDWNRKISSNNALTNKVKSIGLMVKKFGDQGIKQINQELKIKSPKSFLVQKQEILKASAALSDDIFSWGIQIFVCEAFLRALQHEEFVSFSFLFFTDR